jgi:hypothetical protein
MGDEIKGAVAEAVRAVEAEVSAADKARVRDLLAAELRRVTGRLDGLAVSLDIAGLSAAALAPEMMATAIEGHVKDVKARLTEQVRLRVLAEARAAEAAAKLAEAEAALHAQGERLEREKAELCAAAARDAEAARLQLRNVREDANIAGQECERLQARLAAVEAAAEQAAAVAVRPAWGEGTIEIDFADLCPEYDKGPAATAKHVVPLIRLDAFGFEPQEHPVEYHIAAAMRPDGEPLGGWGRPVGPRTSEFFVWVGRTDRLPALHIRNAPPSYTPIHALVMAMERRDREAAAEAVAEAAAAETAEAACPARGPSPSYWRLSPALVERLPEHLWSLRVVVHKLRVTSPDDRICDDYVCQDGDGLYWLIEHGERCGENPAWGEGARQIIHVRRCDAAGGLIPSGDFHATRYPVALLPVVIPA